MKRAFCLMTLIIAVLLQSCKDDNYYDKPSWLEEPIYQYLDAQGNFTHYLECVNKSGFDKNLKNSGFYTAFVPDDNAFAAFLTQNGFTSSKDIPVEMAHKIVSYSLIPVASTAAELDDYQRPVAQTETHTNLNIAFKRATYNYKGVYNYTGFDAINRYVLDANAVTENPNLGGGIVINNFNLKNIPYFTQDFLDKKNIPVADYNKFYPEATFSGFNVADARVTKKDILTENGIIHVIDKVILPLPNLEEVLMNSQECSDFFQMLEQYTVNFNLAPREILLRNEQATGVYRDIYVKDYPALHFAPNCENFMRFGGGYTHDNQIDGWTMFAPTNTALQNYLNTVLLAKGYNTLNEMPLFVLREFINAHFFRTTVWPSKFATVTNLFGEPARFDANTNVVKSKIASNGLFYAVNKVQEANSFSTVLGEILLNPSYTTMYQALVSTLNDFMLKNPILDLDVFLISNQQFDNIGLRYNLGTNQWEHNNPQWLNMSAFMILDRLMQLHVVFNQNVNINSGFGLILTNGGEYIRYLQTAQGPLVWGSGQTLATAARVQPVAGGGFGRLAINGHSYTLDKALLFSTNNIGAFLETNSNYRAFFNYLEKSANSVVEGAENPTELSRMIYNPVTKAITNIPSTVNQTYLIPNATAIANAVAAGLLPPITAASFTQAEQEQVLRFIRYHVINDKIVYPNSGYNGIAYTHYRDNDGATYISVVTPATPNQLEVYDKKGRRALITATSTSGHTNVLANRAVIHLMNNYLDYRSQ